MSVNILDPTQDKMLGPETQKKKGEENSSIRRKTLKKPKPSSSSDEDSSVRWKPLQKPKPSPSTPLSLRRLRG